MSSREVQRRLWLLAVVALAIRLLCLGKDGLWHDEVATFNTAILPVSRIPAVAANHSNSPPLYFWLVHLVIGITGQSESSLRLLSAVAGALTIPVLGSLVIALTESATAGLLAALLLTINPLHLWFSQEARAYAVLTLCCAVALLALARALKAEHVTDWVWFLLATVAGLFVNPVAGAILPVAWIWASLSPRRRHFLLPLLATSAIICLVAVGIAHSIPAHEHPPAEQRGLPGLELGYAAYAYLAGYSFGPGTRDLQMMGALGALREHWLEAGLVVVAMVWWGWLAISTKPRGGAHFLALAVLPPLQIFAASRLSAFPFNVRYALPGVLGAMALLAVAVSASPARTRTIGCAAAVLLSLWSDAQWFTVARYRKDDTRGAVAWLAAGLPAGSTVGAVPGYMNETLEYYAARTSPRLHIVRVAPDSGGVPIDSVQAMAVTRFHLVPGWQELEQTLSARGLKDSTRSILGYHLFQLQAH